MNAVTGELDLSHGLSQATDLRGMECLVSEHRAGGNASCEMVGDRDIEESMEIDRARLAPSCDPDLSPHPSAPCRHLSYKVK